MIQLNKFVLVVVTLFLCISVTSIFGMKLEGSIFQEDKEWIFLDKFCTSNDGATISINVDFGNDNTKLLLYSDVPSKWGKIESRSLTCYEKVAAASTVVGWNSTLNGRTSPINQQRDRWWYVAFASCDGPIQATYSLEFRNNGDSFDSVISADQHGIPQAQIFFFLFFVGLLIVISINIMFLWHRQLETGVMKLHLGVVAVRILSLFIYLMYWAIYIKEDIGNSKIFHAANAFELIAKSLFILLLLLLSQGWTVSHLYGSKISIAVNVLIFFGFLIASLCIYLVPNLTFMPYRTYQYFFDTIPGYILLALYLAIWIWFLVNIRRSHVRHQDTVKKNFFLLIGSVYTAWFLLVPVTVIVAHFVNTWRRNAVITIFGLIIDAIFFSIMTIIFRGSRANPYVNILNLDQNGKGIQLKDSNDGANNDKQEQHGEASK